MSNSFSPNFNFKFGSLDEVLEGNGSGVDSFEDLYCSGRNQTILIPKFVGVFQNENGCEIGSLADDVIRRFAELFKSEERLPENLIALVYDPEVMKENVLLDSIKERNKYNRLKFFSYINAPKFSEKRTRSLEGYFRHLGSIIIGNYDTNLFPIQKDVEELELDRTTYGITLRESVLLKILSCPLKNLKK